VSAHKPTAKQQLGDKPLPPGRDVYDGPVVYLRVEEASLPSGQKIPLDVIRHPGASAIVPLDWNGEVVLIRQYRHAAGGFIYEVPAGKLDGGEAPEVCAARELIEEAGVEAGRIDHLGSILTTPGFTDEVIHLYLGRELIRAEQRLEHDEVLSVERVTLARALEMCTSGEIRDAKTVCALFLADRLLHRELREAREKDR
jgi:ADP-ribose pyrophosphatase